MGKSDWMRIGAFVFDSPVALLMEKLVCPSKLPQEETTEKMLSSCGSYLLKNIKTGIWIAGTLKLMLLTLHFGGFKILCYVTLNSVLQLG